MSGSESTFDIAFHTFPSSRSFATYHVECVVAIRRRGLTGFGTML